MTPETDRNVAREFSRGNSLDAVQAEFSTVNPSLPSSPAYARFAQELAYYRADAPYLTVEKAAERCRTLSALLTLAALGRG
jgi:hypothetical protein